MYYIVKLFQAAIIKIAVKIIINTAIFNKITVPSRSNLAS